MNNDFATAPDRPTIDEDERIRRQHEVDFARGSVRYEGGVLTDEVERLNVRYIVGVKGGDKPGHRTAGAVPSGAE